MISSIVKFCFRTLDLALRPQVKQLLIRLEKLPFELGRVVDAFGNCWFDSVMALLEISELRIGLAEWAKGIKTHQVLNLTFSLYCCSNSVVIVFLNKSFCTLFQNFSSYDIL